MSAYLVKVLDRAPKADCKCYAYKKCDEKNKLNTKHENRRNSDQTQTSKGIRDLLEVWFYTIANIIGRRGRTGTHTRR